MWPFKRPPFLNADTARWHVDNVCWLLRNLRGTPMLSETNLILSGRGFYQVDSAEGPELARQIFEQTKTFAGMSAWSFELIRDTGHEVLQPDQDFTEDTDLEDEEISNEGVPSNDTLNAHSAIIYPSVFEADPFTLIAWFARDLAARLSRSIDDSPPCEESELRGFMDVIACQLGFGVFLADNVINVTWHPGQSDNRHAFVSYDADPNAGLSEDEMIFSLALFLTRKGLPADKAAPYLKPVLADSLKRAMEEAMPYRDELLAAADNYSAD